jgi:hypothetical protein
MSKESLDYAAELKLSAERKAGRILDPRAEGGFFFCGEHLNVKSKADLNEGEMGFKLQPKVSGGN